MLTEFASNVTRYYNLDLLTGSQQTNSGPIHRWHTSVTDRVLAKHYSTWRRTRNEHIAAALEKEISPHVRTRFHSETGDALVR